MIIYNNRAICLKLAKQNIDKWGRVIMFKNKLNIILLCHLVLSVIAMALDFFIKTKFTALFLVILVVFYGAFLLCSKYKGSKINTVFYVFNIIPLFYFSFMCNGWAFVYGTNTCLIFTSIGLIYGLVYVLLFRKKYNDQITIGNKSKFIVFRQIALIAYSGIYLFAFLSFANTYLDHSTEQSILATVISVDGYDMLRTGELYYYFSIDVDMENGQIDNIPLTYNEVKSLKVGDKVDIKAKNGFLGQPYCYYNNYTDKTYYRRVGVIFEENEKDEMDDYIEMLEQ